MNASFLASLVAAALLVPTPGLAHEPVVMIDGPVHIAAADDYRTQADAWKRWADDYSRELRASMGPMFAGRMGSHKVVKGAPYSAQVVTESNQALADGNVISRKTQGAIYRDGQGRMRQELPGDGKEPTVYINDSVEGINYILTPGSKRVIAMRAPGGDAIAKEKGEKVKVKEKQVVRVGDREVRVEDGKVFIDGKEVADGKVEVVNSKGKVIRVENGTVTIDGKSVVMPEPPEGAGVVNKVVVKSIESGDAPDGTRREEVRVQVIRAGDDAAGLPMPPVPPVPPVPPLPPGSGVEHGFAYPMPMPLMPGVQTFRFENMSKLGKGATTNLGTKDFDGVKAEGKSTVWTIPAGEIGNRSPINVTSETWYSNDLQVTVYSRYNDPRTGESIYRLASLRRAEPSADLFKIPTDYTVKKLPRASVR